MGTQAETGAWAGANLKRTDQGTVLFMFVRPIDMRCTMWAITCGAKGLSSCPGTCTRGVGSEKLSSCSFFSLLLPRKHAPADANSMRMKSECGRQVCPQSSRGAKWHAAGDAGHEESGFTHCQLTLMPGNERRIGVHTSWRPRRRLSFLKCFPSTAMGVVVPGPNKPLLG